MYKDLRANYILNMNFVETFATNEYGELKIETDIKKNPYRLSPQLFPSFVSRSLVRYVQVCVPPSV